MTEEPHWSWSSYTDVGSVLEICAVYDDVLKKNSAFGDYAVLLANRILMEKGYKALATYGKWGARLEPAVNPSFSKRELETMATAICTHPSFEALMESTWVFTYGNYNEEIYEIQKEKKAEAEIISKKQNEKFWSRFQKKKSEISPVGLQ